MEQDCDVGTCPSREPVHLGLSRRERGHKALFLGGWCEPPDNCHVVSVTPEGALREGPCVVSASRPFHACGGSVPSCSMLWSGNVSVKTLAFDLSKN